MALPIAHGLVGAGVVAAIWPMKNSVLDRRALVLGAFLGILPDLDYVLTLLMKYSSSYHRGFSHSILFACLIGSTAAFAFGRLNVRTATAFSGAVASHGILDVIVSQKGGVELIWPFWPQRFALGLFDYPDAFDLKYSPLKDVLVIAGGRRLLEISAYEMVLVAPMFLLIVLCRTYLFNVARNSDTYAGFAE
jgi:membrane-bound metal-dependent hydrolase YbcI (DUF457 family)